MKGRIKDFKDKNVWIIGASSGIGAALAKELAASGAHVALSARREDKLAALAKILDGGGHYVAPLDVSDADAVAKAQSDIIKELGSIRPVAKVV